MPECELKIHYKTKPKNGEATAVTMIRNTRQPQYVKGPQTERAGSKGREVLECWGLKAPKLRDHSSRRASVARPSALPSFQRSSGWVACWTPLPSPRLFL